MQGGRAEPCPAGGEGPRALTLLSAGCTMSSKGPAMALGNLLTMRGSVGTLTSCSRQRSRYFSPTQITFSGSSMGTNSRTHAVPWVFLPFLVCA